MYGCPICRLYVSCDFGWLVSGTAGVLGLSMVGLPWWHGLSKSTCGLRCFQGSPHGRCPGRVAEAKVGIIQMGPELSIQKGALVGYPKVELGKSWVGVWVSQGSLHKGHTSRIAVADMGVGSPGALHSDSTWEDS